METEDARPLNFRPARTSISSGQNSSIASSSRAVYIQGCSWESLGKVGKFLDCVIQSRNCTSDQRSEKTNHFAKICTIHVPAKRCQFAWYFAINIPRCTSSMPNVS